MPEKTTLLVIDDEEVMRDSCSQVLQREGYAVELAADGMAGLELLGKTKPEVVLMDLKMPGLCGTELIRRVREMDSRAAIIVITGYASVGSAVEMMKEGACDYLPKPFTPAELHAAVRRGINRVVRQKDAAAILKQQEMAQERFVTIVSHELRSPLNNAQQYLEAMLAGAVGDVQGEQRKVLERISSSVHGLIGLIHDWLNVARIRSGRITGASAPVAMDALIRETAESLRPQAEMKEVAVQVELAASDLMVLGDKRCLEQMLSNLLDNAVKYSQSRGVVSVKVKEEEGEMVKIEVRDAGRGIAEADLPYVFDDFFTIGTGGHDDDVHGYGMGLAIVKQIVEMHSGSVQVSSRVGEGTMFVIFLPRITRPPKPEVEVPAEVPKEVGNPDPLIIAFCCNWCSYAGADLAGVSRIQYPPNALVIRVMCSGMVHPNLVIEALTKGADGVLVCGCHPGDCHYLEGNCKAQQRAEAIALMLEDFGIEPERFRLEWVSASEGPRFAAVMTEMTEAMKRLPPSSYKVA